MKKSEREFWDFLFKKQSAEADRRQYYGILDEDGRVVRGGIEQSDGRFYLQYYKTHASPEHSLKDIDDLQTGKSHNDKPHKIFIAVLQATLIPLALASFYLDEIAARYSFVDPGTVFLVFYAVSLICISIIWFSYENHFVKMDKDWQTAISEILGNNTSTIFSGMSKCMLVFRRFLKWRRYKSFLLYVLILAWITEIVFAVRIVAIADVSLREIGMFASVVVVQVIVFLRLSFLRWYYTNWRDPTMQLCIAIADIDRQLMVAQHPMLADMASGVQPTRKGLAKEKDSSLPVVRHGAVEMTGT